MISNIDQRVFKFTAADESWLDLTIAVNDFQNGKSVALVMEPEDFIYISAFLPFNHKYLKLKTPSPIEVAPKVEVCSSSAEWSEVADIIDYTVGLQLSGVIQWTVDWDKTWGRVSRNRTDIIAMAGAPTVYDAYWIRISFPSGPTAFGLEYVGQLFSDDQDLYAQYPVLQSPTIMKGWNLLKTSWLDQHVLAAEYISKELIQRKVIINQSQLLDIATLRSPAVHKAAHIIYSGLGVKNYQNEIVHSAAAFEQAMRMDKFQVDSDGDGRKGIPDMTVTSSRATR